MGNVISRCLAGRPWRNSFPAACCKNTDSGAVRCPRGAPCAKRTYRKNTASGVVRCPPGAPVPHRTCCKNTDSGAVRCPRGAPLKKESACFAVVLVGAPRERPWGVINIIRWNTPGVPPSQGRRSNGHESHHGTDGCPWFHGGTEKGMRWVHVVPRRE